MLKIDYKYDFGTSEIFYNTSKNPKAVEAAVDSFDWREVQPYIEGKSDTRIVARYSGDYKCDDYNYQVYFVDEDGDICLVPQPFKLKKDALYCFNGLKYIYEEVIIVENVHSWMPETTREDEDQEAAEMKHSMNMQLLGIYDD